MCVRFPPMATYVLVHGAWHGSWCWKRVRKALQAAGHDVFTPTLTGVGERSHLNSPGVNLSTHIADVANLIRWEELSDVILCGHSYGGCVISGAADSVSDRIRAVVYLDAFVLEDREALIDLLPPELQVPAACRQTGYGFRRRLEAGPHSRGGLQCQSARCRLGEPPMHFSGACGFRRAHQTHRWRQTG